VPKFYRLAFFALIAGILSADTLIPRGSSDIENSALGIQSNLNFAGRVPNFNDFALMDRLAETGVKWVRYWLNWYQVEADSGVYDFTAADSAISGYTDRGIKVYLTLFSGNQWYDGPDSSVYMGVAHPEQGLSPIPGSPSMQGWLKFVETAVTRYADKVQYWDIWNEPNIDFWQPTPNPANYAQLLKLTAQKIKSIDPKAKIIGLGTSTIDFDYISDVLKENIIEFIDYLGFHPYRYYPEDDQDNMGLPYPPSPFANYDEELQALKDTLKKYDPLGRVELWDEEAGYPSHPEIFIWTPDTIYSSEATQAKYLLRRFLLNLGFGVRGTTWFCDYDQVSAYPSILGPNWYQHYYDANWHEKEVSFPFNYLGITYSPPAETILLEAEDYDSLYSPLKNGGTYIYTTDGDGDLKGSAVYNFTVLDSGIYTVWLSIRNPDETAVFIVSLVDTVSHWVTNARATGTGSLFIWSLPMDIRLIRWNYLGRGPYYFNLNRGSHRLRIQTGTDGSSLDKIVIKREGPALFLKPAYYALQNLAAVFDYRMVPDSELGVNFENIDVSPTDWRELRRFAFSDTSGDDQLITYWLGIKAGDDYPGHYTRLSVKVNSITNPKLINLLDGSITAITDFTTTDSTVIFNSLPIADFPYCLALNWSTGIAEKTGDRLNQNISLTVFPNPFIKTTEIKYHTPAAGHTTLKIYNPAGELVQTLVDESQGPGYHTVYWRGHDMNSGSVSSGIYFCRLATGKCNATKKVIIICR
jgi:hypothetical protein